MITIKRLAPVFDFDNNTDLYAYRNGTLFAYNEGYGWVFLKGAAYDSLTRAKGFRYWEKHFPNRASYALPALLKEALEMPPQSSGTFLRNGELWGYEG